MRFSTTSIFYFSLCFPPDERISGLCESVLSSSFRGQSEVPHQRMLKHLGHHFAKSSRASQQDESSSSSISANNSYCTNDLEEAISLLR